MYVSRKEPLSALLALHDRAQPIIGGFPSQRAITLFVSMNNIIKNTYLFFSEMTQHFIVNTSNGGHIHHILCISLNNSAPDG